MDLTILQAAVGLPETIPVGNPVTGLNTSDEAFVVVVWDLGRRLVQAHERIQLQRIRYGGQPDEDRD